MSDVLAKLKAAGASCVGGTLYIGREEVALMRTNQVIVLPAGEKYLAPPAAVSEPAPAPAPAGIKRTAKKATPAPTEPEATTGPNADVLGALDQLLA